MMANEIAQRLYESAVGELVLKYIRTLRAEELLPLMDSEALELLSEIREALNDDTTEDPECFRRIEAIINAFEDKGVPVARHDW